MALGAATPILRIFDLARAYAFYRDYLGCTLDWEHRFEPGMPLYAQVSRDGMILHLSEHHGDGTPGTTVYVVADDVPALARELAAKDYPNLRVDPASLELALPDPFGNTIRIAPRAG